MKEVKYLLKKKLSPEQISGRLFLEKGIKISHQEIYDWIERHEKEKEENKNEFTRELRIKSKHKQRNKSEKVHIKELITIDKRE